MQIFCDFDDVLFDTRRFTQDLRAALCRTLDMTAEAFDTSYQKARARDGIANYSFTRHVDIIATACGVDRRAIISVVDAFTANLEEYVFPDVRENLQKFRDAGHAPFLVTFGSPTLQEKKIAGSKLGAFFVDARIGEIDKAIAVTTLQKEYGRHKAVYCEDRMEHLESVHRAHPDITGIIIVRPEGRYSDHARAHEHFTLYENAADLNGVQHIISELAAEVAREQQESPSLR